MSHIPQPDPHPAGGTRWLGRPCSFSAADGRRLVGTIEAARYLGRTVRGEIPDYTLTIRGKSGATMEISLVENYVSLLN